MEGGVAGVLTHSVCWLRKPGGDVCWGSQSRCGGLRVTSRMNWHYWSSVFVSLERYVDEVDGC